MISVPHCAPKTRVFLGFWPHGVESEQQCLQLPPARIRVVVLDFRVWPLVGPTGSATWPPLRSWTPNVFTKQALSSGAGPPGSFYITHTVAYGPRPAHPVASRRSGASTWALWYGYLSMPRKQGVSCGSDPMCSKGATMPKTTIGSHPSPRTLRWDVRGSNGCSHLTANPGFQGLLDVLAP